MTQTKHVRLKAKAGTTLNDIVEFIRAQKRDLPKRVEEFLIVEGAAPLFGAGDAPTVEIIIRYTGIDQDTLDDIQDIIDAAGQRADEIIITVDEE